VSAEYIYIKDACRDFEHLGVKGLPKGVFSDCPACGFAMNSEVTLAGKHYHRRPQHSIFIDFCHKLSHLFRKCWRRVEEDSATPPNTRYFLANLWALAFVRCDTNARSPLSSVLC
jgi:hypothetical protein